MKPETPSQTLDSIKKTFHERRIEEIREIIFKVAELLKMISATRAIDLDSLTTFTVFAEYVQKRRKNTEILTNLTQLLVELGKIPKVVKGIEKVSPEKITEFLEFAKDAGKNYNLFTISAIKQLLRTVDDLEKINLPEAELKQHIEKLRTLFKDPLTAELEKDLMLRSFIEFLLNVGIEGTEPALLSILAIPDEEKTEVTAITPEEEQRLFAEIVAILHDKSPLQEQVFTTLWSFENHAATNRQVTTAINKNGYVGEDGLNKQMISSRTRSQLDALFSTLSELNKGVKLRYFKAQSTTAPKRSTLHYQLVVKPVAEK